MLKLDINSEGKFAYNIIIEKSFDNLRKELENIVPDFSKICVVTDTNVEKLYLEALKSQCNFCEKLYTFVFKAGEQSKSLNVVSELYKFLIEKEFDRRDFLIALGGGVVGDLCGYAAATFLRGIDFIQIPTTLLSIVDSSIGGKTGLDFNGYKNMIGAFYMPRLVYINISTILTLDSVQYASGMAEVIKYGLIRDKKFYEYLILNKKEIKNRNLENLEYIALRADEIKKEVVELDFKEENIRSHLNFGHTLGHAIEKYMNFELSHGACVALGSLCAMEISKEKAYINNDEIISLKDLFRYFGLSTSLEFSDNKKILEYTKNDKKMTAGKIKFILLKSIGHAIIDRSVGISDMEKALRSIEND